jgi:hypothetical protein
MTPLECVFYVHISFEVYLNKYELSHTELFLKHPSSFFTVIMTKTNNYIILFKPYTNSTQPSHKICRSMSWGGSSG